MGVGDGQDDKKRFYAECGVREYWIYDPEGHRTDSVPILQGFRLHADKQYQEITPVPEDKLWWSDVLQTHWGLAPQKHGVEETYAQLRVLDPKTGAWTAQKTNASGNISRIRRGRTPGSRRKTPS